MGDSDPRTTAKICDLAAFRRARAARRAVETCKAPSRPVGGEAWYHEAAMREDDRTRRS